MESPLALRLLAVLFLVAANAFFVAAEFVLVSVRATRLRELEAEGHSAAGTALRLKDHVDEVVSATQLGITLASLALGWVGEQAVADMLMPLLAMFTPVARLAVAHTIALTLAFLLISAMHLVLGEVVPKNVALARNDRLALLIARPMDLFMKATYPFMRALNAAAAAISRLFGAESPAHHHVHSPEELKMLVTAGREVGVLPEHLEAMVHGILDLREILVREVMVPRPDIVSVSVDAPLEELVRKLAEHPHSRVPVYEGAPERLIGVIYAKDLYRAWTDRQAALLAGRPPRDFKLRSLVRDVPIVPETKAVDQLLEEFKRRRRRIALVVDEFGSIVGLVTVKDVLERMIGHVTDEYVRREAPAATAEVGLILEGSTHIREIEERYELHLPRERGFETLAGFLLSHFGHIPKPGEALVFDGWQFTVEEMDRYRIASVRLERLPAQPGADQTSAASPGSG